MPEERLTQVKMADGSIYKVVYMTEESQQPEYVRRLAKLADGAGKNAVKELLAKGIPVVFAKDGHIVRHYPDGHEEIIGELTRQWAHHG